MKNRVVAIAVICGLFIIASNFPSLPSVKAKSETLLFSLPKEESFDNKPAKLLKANFSASIEVVSGSLEPNGSTPVSISVSTSKMNMSLELSYDVDPLTNETFETPSFEVDPFTEDNYPVQMPAGRTVPTLINLTLNLKGSINSTLEIHGPGSFNGSKKESFSWTPQKSQTLTLTNTSEAIIGDLINVTLHDVEYDLNAELRYYYNSSGTVRNSSIVGNFTIPTDKNPSIVGTFKLEYPFPWRTAIWGGVAALGVSSFAFGVLCTVSKRELSHVQKRKTHAAALRVEHVVAVKTCSSCGTPNSAEAKFCKKCGMQL